MVRKEIGVDRREFLKAAGLTAVVASTAGTTAALLTDKKSRPIVPAPDINLQEVFQGQPSAQTPSLAVDLMTAQIENARLRAQLKAAERRLEITEIRQNGREGKVAETLQAQLDETSAINSSLIEELAAASGLIALYEQLDNVDVGAVAESGLSAVEGLFEEIAEQLPAAKESLEIGQQLVDDIGASIPNLQEGRNWLVDQFGLIGSQLDDLESSLEGNGNIFELLGGWFESLLEWLPFGIGQKAVGTMNRIRDLVSDILATRVALDDKVVAALDAMIGTDKEVPLKEGDTVNPVRDDITGPAKKVVDQASVVETAFHNELAQPVAKAKALQDSYRELIAAYRESHQV